MIETKNIPLQNILQFMQLLISFQHIERVAYVQGFHRAENDAEHSYQLAMLARFVVADNKLPLDIHKVILYALAHDLVEVHAGDTFAFTKDEALRANKKERELAALEQIKKDFPQFTSLTDAIQSYEDKADPESNFVYALDKIIPDFNPLLGGGNYIKLDVTLDDLDNHVGPKTQVDPFIHELRQQVRQIITSDPQMFFGQK